MKSNRRLIFTADSRFTFAKPAGIAGPGILTGYALVWNVPSTDRGGYKVKLLPGSAIFANPTHALFHHDYRLVIGNTENSTLKLIPDSYGVKVEIELPDTSTGRDVAELVSKKYVRGMSFAMVDSPIGRQSIIDGEEIFIAEKFDVDEVTVTPIPSFTTATVGMQQPDDAAGNFSTRTGQALQLDRLRLADIRLPGAELPRPVAV